MKYKVILILIVFALITTGCSLNNNKQTNQQKKGDTNKQEKTVEVTKKYYDESRLKDKADSFPEIFNSFSFIVNHPLDPNNEFGETVSKIYSFKSTDKLKASIVYKYVNTMKSLNLLYTADDGKVISINVVPSMNTKSNYKEHLKEKKIVKETDDYVEILVSNEPGVSYNSLIRWFDNYSLEFSVTNESKDIVFKVLEEAASTITQDNNDALLVDKAIQSMVNYDGKQLTTYEYVDSVSKDNGIYALKDGMTMYFSYKRVINSSCSEFFAKKINDNPEVFKCSNNDYRVVATDKAIETYYYFSKGNENDDKRLKESSFNNLKSLINEFFEN